MQQHSSIQTHVAQEALLWGLKYHPSPPFNSIITPEKVKHEEITSVTAALKGWPGQYDAWLHTEPSGP